MLNILCCVFISSICFPLQKPTDSWNNTMNIEFTDNSSLKSWSENTNNIFSKCMQRLYFFRLLRSFGIDNTIIAMFYSSVMQIVVAFNAITWWASVGKGQQDTLNRIRKKAIKLFGDTVPLLDDIVTKNAIKKVTTIRTDISHPLNHQYATMRSNHRFRAISARTLRYR